jgi:hypothetical protein
MAKSRLIYQADQEVVGKHFRSDEYVWYSGQLKIYDRKTYPVVLNLKSEIADSFLSMGMDEKIEFKGGSVSEVFGKLSKWYYQRGILFRN